MSRRLAVAMVALATGAAVSPARAEMDADQTLPAELSLETALRIGRRLQPQLRQARALTEAAEARVDQARAPLLPQVNLTATYSRATNNFAPPPGGTSAGMNPTSDPSFDHLQLLEKRHHRDAADLGLRPGLAEERRRARHRRGPGGHGAGDAALRRPGDPVGVLSGAGDTRRGRRRARDARQPEQTRRPDPGVHRGRHAARDRSLAGAHRSGERRGRADQRAE